MGSSFVWTLKTIEHSSWISLALSVSVFSHQLVYPYVAATHYATKKQLGDLTHVLCF
jgi:hypothetical protein